MNGAESALRTAVAAGVNVCFANPGTTEMPLVGALDAAPGMRSVLALFEGVCTGAADGYARMAGHPALTLVHLGPGLGKGIANLHNARRARSPIVNLVGDQATWHRQYDAPLTSDIAALASNVSGWQRSTASANQFAADMAEAIAAAGTVPGQIATLIVPVDCQWGGAAGAATPRPATPLAIPDSQAIEAAAKVLRGNVPAMLFLGGTALSERGLEAAARVAAATGCRVIAETFPSRTERGAGRLPVERLPYFPEPAIEALAKFGALVLAGASEPVAFFGYEGLPSRLAPPECALHVLARPADDAAGALEALAGALGADAAPPANATAQRPERPTGPLSRRGLAQGIAAVLPEGAIVSDESGTTGVGTNPYLAVTAPHTLLYLTGGSIGQAIPVATGAAVAYPDRRVLAVQGDGGGAYTLQALWTQAREQLNVTTIICANRRYEILRVELQRAGITEPGPQARALTDLTHPEIDWSLLARGFGVPATRVDTAEALMAALDRSLAEPGPSLIEAILPGA